MDSGVYGRGQVKRQVTTTTTSNYYYYYFSLRKAYMIPVQLNTSLF